MLYGRCEDCASPITDWNGKPLRPYVWDDEERRRYCFECYYPSDCEVCGEQLDLNEIDERESGRCSEGCAAVDLDYYSGNDGDGYDPREDQKRGE